MGDNGNSGDAVTQTSTEYFLKQMFMFISCIIMSIVMFNSCLNIHTCIWIVSLTTLLKCLQNVAYHLTRPTPVRADQACAAGAGPPRLDLDISLSSAQCYGTTTNGGGTTNWGTTAAKNRGNDRKRGVGRRGHEMEAGWRWRGEEVTIISKFVLPPSTKECNYGIRVIQTCSSLTKSKLNSIYTYNFE
jgi:hypothetical protein